MNLRDQPRASLFLAIASVLSLALLLSVQTATAADSKSEQSVYGYWKSVDKETGKTQSIFKLYEDKGKLVGKIVKIFPKAGEKHNPICSECEGPRKNQPKEGIVFFWNFVPSKDKTRKWIDGKILNPDDGKVYGSEATLSEDGTKLSVYGYIRILIKIGGTNVWTRPTAAELAGV